jgi:hypothetical protein
MPDDLASDILDAVEKRYSWLPASRTLLIALLAAGGLGFLVSHLLTSAEIAGLERDRDNFKSLAQLYEAKLKVGSPDEALKKLESLEARIEELRPKAERHLTDEQKQELATALAPIAGDLRKAWLMITSESTGEAQRLAMDFASLFQEDLKIATLRNNGFAMLASEHGIMVGLRNPERPSDLALKFIDALKRGGLTDVKTTKWGIPPGDNTPLDFDLFIGLP